MERAHEKWREVMKNLGAVGTRRQLFRVMAAGAASVPFLRLTSDSASAGWCTAVKCSCLLKGTKILTPSGDCLVQDLHIEDEVQTAAGRKTIKWIAYNKFTKEKGSAWQDSVMPIRIARFAIDDQTPHRDLYLAPRHHIFFNEVLIPVFYLINETSIAQRLPSGMSEIEYYHIELDTHEVIYAEGASVESYYCDTPHSRETFSNFVEYERLYGVDLKSMTQFAPMVGYNRASSEIKALVRSLISNVVDVRDPIQIAYDQIAKRAEAMLV
jgi:hypothetical protein